MKAAVLYEPHQPLVIEEIRVRKPVAREVLLRTAVAGLCHSDLHFMEGLYRYPLPVVLGHESSAVVEEVGSEVTYVKPGDRVVTCLSVFCGTCENCTTGRPALCTNTDVKLPPGKATRLEWDKPARLHTFSNLSSFAEQMLVHENAIVKIRDDMPLDRAALIGCGVMTGFGAAVNTAKVRPGETVAVIGCGGVGMAAVNGAYIAGAGRIIAVDTNPAKLQAATKLGATDLLRERKVQGSSMGSNRFRVDMPRLIELYLQGRLHLDDWISQRIRLQQINEGFEAMKAGKVIRSIIDFEAA